MERVEYTIKITHVMDGKVVAYGYGKAAGYVFIYSGFRFGVAKWCAANWAVTELSTGFKVAGGRTRKEAVEALLKDREIMERIRVAAAENEEDLNSEIVPKTEYLVAR